jgi:hypothetical protein
LLLINAYFAEAGSSLKVLSSIFYREVSLTFATISAHFIDTICIIQKCFLRSTNCGGLSGKMVFTMFLLTLPLWSLNILLLPAESTKTAAKRVDKQRSTTGNQDILLLENKSTDNTAKVFVLEPERRIFLKWMRARIYRIKSWLNLSINKRSIIYILSTNIRIFV